MLQMQASVNSGIRSGKKNLKLKFDRIKQGQTRANGCVNCCQLKPEANKENDMDDQ